jgi:hypothetical protein
LAASLRASSASQPNTRTMNRQMRRMNTSAERKAAGQTVRKVLAHHRLTIRSGTNVARSSDASLRSLRDSAHGAVRGR